MQALEMDISYRSYQQAITTKNTHAHIFHHPRQFLINFLAYCARSLAIYPHLIYTYIVWRDAARVHVCISVLISAASDCPAFGAVGEYTHTQKHTRTPAHTHIILHDAAHASSAAPANAAAYLKHIYAV